VIDTGDRWVLVVGEVRAMTTYYDILGLAPTASADEIKAAYRHLATQLHPDKTPGANKAVLQLIEDRFKQVQGAYDTLKDKRKRAEYDATLRSADHQGSLPSPPPLSRKQRLRQQSPRTRPGAASKQRREFFTVGSSKTDVVRVQGTPTRLTSAYEWNYGLSSVDFEDGRVVGWRSSMLSPLKVRMSEPRPRRRRLLNNKPESGGLPSPSPFPSTPATRSTPLRPAFAAKRPHARAE
jgi:curved DNA-binding protein CbpA